MHQALRNEGSGIEKNLFEGKVKKKA